MECSLSFHDSTFITVVFFVCRHLSFAEAQGSNWSRSEIDLSLSMVELLRVPSAYQTPQWKGSFSRTSLQYCKLSRFMNGFFKKKNFFCWLFTLRRSCLELCHSDIGDRTPNVKWSSRYEWLNDFWHLHKSQKTSHKSFCAEKQSVAIKGCKENTRWGQEL